MSGCSGTSFVILTFVTVADSDRLGKVVKYLLSPLLYLLLVLAR